MRNKVKNKHKPNFSVEVDQSGKVEDTSLHTFISLSNGIRYTIKMPKNVKRDCILLFRKLGKTGKTFYLQLFSAGLCLLLVKHAKKFSSITIDEEYVSKSKTVKEYLINYLTKKNVSISPGIFSFQHIGKKSNAHILAISCTRGSRKEDTTVSLDQLLDIIISKDEKEKIGDSFRR